MNSGLFGFGVFFLGLGLLGDDRRLVESLAYAFAASQFVLRRQKKVVYLYPVFSFFLLQPEA